MLYGSLVCGIDDFLGETMNGKRPQIELNMSYMDLMILMSEGNPGALTVLAEMFKRGDNGIMAMLHLDDMNIRGSQVWVGYKDHCGHDLDKFLECIRERSPEMVQTINQICAGYGEIAVIGRPM